MRRAPGLPIQQLVGAFIILGGLWHAAAPWIFGYANLPAAVVSNVAAGVALALVGIGFIVFRGGRVLNWIGIALGFWVTVSPIVLGLGRPWLAMLEASWGGPLTLALIAIAAYDLRFNHPEPRPESELERGTARA